MADTTIETRNTLGFIASATFGADYLLADDMRPEYDKHAKIFAAAIGELNQRLFKCEQLISVGQRSEAIRQGSIEPDVLKRCGELDIPRRAEWTQFCGRVGLTIPAAPNMTIAATLNKAYADEKVAEPLLQEFRLLSLARASMQKRLSTLRLLVRAEPANVSWNDDLAKFEQVRCDEIRTLATRVRQKRDWDLASQLVDEVQSNLWVNRPPLEVIDAVIRAQEELFRDEAQRAFAELERRIDEAIRADDLAAAEAVQSDIRSVATQFKLADNDPLLDQFGDAFGWIAECQRQEARTKAFERSVRDLTKAIRDNQEWWYIEQCYNQAMAYEYPIDEEILRSYDRAKRNRGVMKKAIAIGVIVVLFLIVIVLLAKKQ
jgi:hypothetical protein